MAKKKEIKKDIKKEEVKEIKKEKSDIKTKLIKTFKKNKSTIIKSTISVVAIIVVIFVLIVSINAIKTNSLDNIDYPLVYQRKNGEIVLLKSKDKEGKDGTIISTSDGTGYTTYGNKSNRYVLTKKGNDLYVFDTKKNEEETKISDDTSVYGFSKDDSYVYMMDSDRDMYSYNFKKPRQLLDAAITGIKDVSNKAVIYEKDSKLYFISFKPEKEDKTELVNGFSIAEFSKDGKAVLYTNSNNVLYRYDIKKKKHTKIASNVETFYCDEKSCDEMYYSINGAKHSLMYYNGKNSEIIVENYYAIEAIDVKRKMIIYTGVEKENKGLYYQKNGKKSIQIAQNYSFGNDVKMTKDSVYYINEKKELLYAPIKKNKLGKFNVIDKEIEGNLKDYNQGIYYLKNGNKQSEATVIVVSKDKIKKVADDVNKTRVSVSNNGKKIYFIKSLENNTSGELYVFDGKDSHKISDNVQRFLYIRDDLVYYLKNFSVDERYGELHKYDGSKTKKIDDKVSELSSTPNAYIIK